MRKAKFDLDENQIKPYFEVSTVLEKGVFYACLLYTSDAADERSSVDLGGRRIIKKKKSSWSGRLMYMNDMRYNDITTEQIVCHHKQWKKH